MSNILIAVDAGHGSNTAGKRTPPMPVNIDFEKDGKVDVKKGDFIREHIANVGVCILLEEELIRNGFSVLRSGWDDENAYDDEDVALVERQKKIKKAGCKYSVSIHFNAYGNGEKFNSVNGILTYIHNNPSRAKKSKTLANYVQNQLSQGTAQKNRGVLEEAFAMCNCINLGTEASILVELGFMTNLHEARYLMGSADFWEECAKEICRGFCQMEHKAYIETSDETVKSYGKLKQEMNIREDAGVSYDLIATYPRGTIIEIISEKKEWYCIKCPEAAKGYGYVSNKDGRYISIGSWLYEVKKDDTLWMIAKRYLKNGSLYKDIMELNHLTSTVIQKGDLLLMP